MNKDSLQFIHSVFCLYSSCTCVAGFNKNLFGSLWNITTLVAVVWKGSSRKCGIYVQLNSINWYIGTELFLWRLWGIWKCGWESASSKFLSGCFLKYPWFFIHILSWITGDFYQHQFDCGNNKEGGSCQIPQCKKFRHFVHCCFCEYLLVKNSIILNLMILIFTLY